MTLNKVIIAAAVLGFISVTPSHAFDYVVDPANNGFELPNITAVLPINRSQTTADSWFLTGLSGTVANGSRFSMTGADNGNSDGTMSKYGQAAYLRSDSGTISQRFVLAAGATDDGTTSVTFDEEGNNEIKVYMGLTLLYDGTPDSTTSFDTVTTPFTGDIQPDRAYTLTFLTVTNGLANISYIDDVVVTTSAVPEPADWAWIPVLGVLAVVALRRMRVWL